MGQIRGCDGESCVFEWLLSDGSCNGSLSCAEYGWDDGDCEPECPVGQIPNCAGTGCIHAGWVGDTYCDSGLNCESYEWDGGDCCPEGEIKGCDQVACVPDKWIADGSCDDALFCPQTEYDGGDCQPITCDEAAGDVLSCFGDSCVAGDWVGDGACDAKLNCTDHANDGGDCCPVGQIRGCDGVTCVAEWQLSDGFCNAALDCQAFEYDEGDCCVPGTVEDCGGGCADEGAVGDGICDTPLNCEATAFDGGDCEAICPEGQIVDCYTMCTPESWVGDTICDASLNCDTFASDGGDCVPDCPEGEHIACDGVTCALDSLISNGTCDEILNCEAEMWDGEDCAYCGDGTCDTNEHTFNCDADCDPQPGAWCENPNTYPNLQGPVWGCNEECVQWDDMADAAGNGQCDAFAACDALDWDGGECCAPPTVMGCNDLCINAGWEGDNWCDFAFNCAGNNFDGGDCEDQADMMLLVNELDPNQAGTDNAEFVELMNTSETGLVLDGGWRIDVINGANGQLKNTWAFSGNSILSPGTKALIGAQSVIDAAPAFVQAMVAPDGFLENAHEAIGVFRWDGPSADWILVDSVHWDGPVEGYGEGDPAPGDDPNTDVSIGRCPDGADTDDNALDFYLNTPTPGADNACGAP